jgi:hypothetical protein
MRWGTWKSLTAKLIALFWILLPGASVYSAEAPWKLDQLMHALAGAQQHQARFVEIRELALLQQPLRSEGTLRFRPPNTLIKQFDPPNGLYYEIDDNRLLIRKPDGEEEIVRLDNAPQLLAYATALRAVHTGDLKQLQRYFGLSLSGNRDTWRLLLTPKANELSHQVRNIEITGSGGNIGRFVVSEQGGDQIITSLQTLHDQ